MMSDQDQRVNMEQFGWAARELPIKFFGDPILRTVCDPVGKEEFGDDTVKKIATELVDTLQKYRARTGMGRGLAANQIGHTKRMVAVWFDDEPEVMCNPEVVSSEGLGSYFESCISSGALLVGEVHRPWTAKFSFRDLDGNEKQFEADEKQTRILLHEIDHLDGITCDKKYLPKTLKIVTGGKEEILGYTFKRLK